MRKLVTLRKISELHNIPNADMILLAKVDGWQCVVKKDEFNVGDWGLYFEIDSMVPYEEWSKHLFKSQKDIDKGFLRIKTIKLRGQLSQGLMIPLNALIDKDLTEVIGVYKYEPPVPSDMSAKSKFPSFIAKTDEERVQNLTHKLDEWLEKPVYESEKLEGSSITCYCVRNHDIETTDPSDKWLFGVCSRNLELKLEHTDENGINVPVENKFVSTVRKLNIQEKMRAWCEKHNKDLVLQGELIGEGIQGNIYNLIGQDIRFFTSQDGKHGRLNVKNILNELELKSVPILNENIKLSSKLDELLNRAEGKSVLNDKQEREGIVIRAMDNSFSFKIISNKYLLKNER